jgi:5'-nucleotidase
MKGIVSPGRIFPLLAAATLLLGLPPAAMAQQITILHTNDMHSHLLGYGPNGEYTPLTTGDDGTLGGMARLKGKIDEIRTNRGAEKTLLLDGGDFMMGSAFVFLRGAAELAVMNAMGYDVLTLGNHEFDWTSAGTAQILSNIPGLSLNLPVVSSNLNFDPADPGDDALKALYDAGVVQDTFVKTVNGVKVGFFGLVGERAADVAPLAAPVVFGDPVAAAAAAVSVLQGEGAELIVCLSHGGLDEDSALAAAVPDIDVIISGHTHEKTPDTGPITVGDTLIVQAGAYTRYLGILDLDLTAGTHAYSLVPIDDCIEPEGGGGGCICADAELDILVGTLKGLVDGQLASEGYDYTFDQVVAETEYELVATDGEESNLGNLITDAMRWMVDQYDTPATDIAIESNGVIRDNILRGTLGPPFNENIGFSDAFAAVPLGFGLEGAIGYPMLSFYLTGAEIKKALELIVIAYPMMGGDYWLNVSGLRYEYMPGGIPLASVTKLEVGDEVSGYTAINKKRLYKVAINFYVAQFIDGIPSLIDGLLGIPGIGNLFKIVPKDASGVPVENLADARVDTDPDTEGIQELQEWQGFVEYFGTFDDLDDDEVPEVPALYSGPTGRITEVECFVATAAYGSPFEGKVALLRDFRDRILLKSAPGRTFVDFYYTHGPALAHGVAQSDWLKALARVLLLPFVGAAKLLLWIL